MGWACKPCGYDCRMCSHQEWQSLSRRFREAVDEVQLPGLVADALVRIEAFLEELEGPSVLARGRPPC